MNAYYVFKVVPKPSAVVPGARDAEVIALTKDHINMVKARSPEDSNYKTLSGHLVLMAQEAGPKVLAKWRRERRYISDSGKYLSLGLDLRVSYMLTMHKPVQSVTYKKLRHLVEEAEDTLQRIQTSQRRTRAYHIPWKIWGWYIEQHLWEQSIS